LTCRTPEMPGHKRNLKPDRSGLELLASCRDGCTEAMMFAHGFTVSQMVNLVRDGLATAYTERVIGGSRATIEIAPLLVQSRDPTSISRRKRRASGLLPQLASLAVPEAEAPLPPDPRANLSVEHTCHREIRVRHDAPAARPC
jgi:hypothetical protein